MFTHAGHAMPWGYWPLRWQRAHPDRQPAPAATGDPLIDNCGPVTADGFCGVAFGMTPREAAEAFIAPLETHGDIASADAALACFMLFPAGRAPDLSFVVVDGVVARVDVGVPGVRTASGIEVGSREAAVLSADQAAVAVFPNKYDAALRDIVVMAAPNRRYVFETDGRAVVRYRAGVMPAVGYVEGCG
jgi:hypothetical protein